MADALIEFNPKLSKLSDEENKVLKLLLEVGRLIASIYKEQENEKYLGANFYPHDSTKSEIEKAATKDPTILSPYTIVERMGGKLQAIPYHIKYEILLKPIADKILQAAKISTNKDFSKSLKLQAEALLKGSYDDAIKFWINKKPYKINFLAAPVERYDDKLMHAKASYQAWVGVLDEKRTEDANLYKEAILTARRKALMPTEKVDFYDKVRARVDDLLLFSGFMAKAKFIGVFLPNGIEMVEATGAKIVLFKQLNDPRIEKEILPSFNKSFSSAFRQSFTKEDLQRGNMMYVFLHELAHTYLSYRSAEQRLGDLYPIIVELSASVYGMRMCGSLLLKDMVTSKDLESIMVSFMSRSLYLAGKESKRTSSVQSPHYVVGGAIFINYMIETEAIQFAEGLTIPNFMKMFVSLDNLATILEKLLASGSRKDADLFVKKYSKTPV